MIQIRYNANVPLRFEFPVEWDPEAITGLTLTVKDRSEVELLAADAATLYTATTLSAAAEQFSDELTLDAGATDLEPGDPILVAGIAGPERRVVKGFDTANKLVELEEILNNPHESGDAVYGLFASYTLDTTTVADFPAGENITLIWTPAGTGNAVTQIAQIAKAAWDPEGFERDFRDLYSRAYVALTEPDRRFDSMLLQAERRVDNELRYRHGLDLQRIVDQSAMSPLIMAELAYMWTFDGDENKKDEREFYGKQRDTELQQVLSWPLWQDTDQDNKEDEGEKKTHVPTFYRSW